MTDIVVTGIGALSAVGSSAQQSFDALVHGRSGIRRVSFELDPRCEVQIAGQLASPLDAAPVLGPREARRHGRVTQLAAVAAREALDCAGFAEARYDPERVACIVGVGIGGLEMLLDTASVFERRGPGRLSPFGITGSIPNMPAGMVSVLANAQGPCFCTASACASSAHAIGEALRLLRAGEIDAAICGGAEACVLPTALAAFARMGALSRRNGAPESASRPFDRDRDGFVLAEGGGILVLERDDCARRRGAPRYARLLGYGASGDAYHPAQPAPDGRGAAAAMRRSLSMGSVAPEHVDYINAHGTSTAYNDVVEVLAIKSVFGQRAYEIPISSTKSMTGHMLGGTGAFEAVMCVLTLQRALIAPTINLDCPDPECDLDFVAHTAREVRTRYALSNSFGFGGQNACLLFGAL